MLSTHRGHLSIGHALMYLYHSGWIFALRRRFPSPLCIQQVPGLLGMPGRRGGVLLFQFHLPLATYSCTSPAKVRACLLARQHALHDRLLGSIRPIGAPQTHLQQGAPSVLARLLFVSSTYHLLCRRPT